MQLPRKRDQLWPSLTLCVRLPALTLSSPAPHTVARAFGLATVIALSNSETAPSIWRISLEVGPSSRNDDGLSAAMAQCPGRGASQSQLLAP